MALKPTIYKLKINLSDIDKNHYDTLSLTVAQHPSETLERMMARVLAYCMNAQDNLSFTKGLSEPDEPDLWVRTLDDQMSMWIDVGEPAADRIKKATRLAAAVKVYSFNRKSDAWWNQESSKFGELGASVFQFRWEDMQALAAMVDRTMELSVTLSGDSAYVATDGAECEAIWSTLQE
ncbi:MAG: YaeQ family protein [Halioglobus sp.]